MWRCALSQNLTWCQFCHPVRSAAILLHLIKSTYWLSGPQGERCSGLLCLYFTAKGFPLDKGWVCFNTSETNPLQVA